MCIYIVLVEIMNVWVVFLIHCFCLLPHIGFGVGQEDYASLCPERVCNSTLGETRNLDSCCQRCSCRPDCYQFASCCPEVRLSDVSGFVYPCINLMKLSNEERNIEYNLNDESTYRLVMSCPDARSAITYPRCGSPSNLQDYVPVSDTNYEKVFRNRHCAACHKVNAFISWNLSVTCENIAYVSFETFDKRNEYILKHCHFVPVPPSEKTDLSRCYSNTIEECNVTQQWDFYDPYLVSECRRKRASYNTLYTQTSENGFSIDRFNNVFCFLCNPKHMGTRNTCKRQESSVYKFRFVVYSALLNLFPEDTLSRARRCHSTEMWDPFEDVCRRMLCPAGTIPRNGKCQSTSWYSEGFTILVIFEIVPSKQNNVIFYKVFLQSFLDVVMNSMGADFHCGTCSERLVRYLNETQPYLELGVFTTKSCSQQFLFGKLRSLVYKKNITVTMRNNNVTVSIILKPVLTEKNVETKTTIVAVKQKICFIPLQLTYLNMNTCPRFQLTKHEFDKLNLDPSALDIVVDSSSLNSSMNSSISLCVDDYFQLQTSASACNGCKNTYTTATLAATCYVVFFYKLLSLIV